MADPGDRRPAAAGGRLRASDADREQVIEVLKDAFVQGRLTGHELDAPVGQALASRTYAELAALTVDIPAGSAAAPLTCQPARAQNRAPGNHTVRNVAIGLGLGLIVAAVIVSGGLQYIYLLLPLAFPFLVVAPFVLMANSSERRRSRKQLPPRPGQGGQVWHLLNDPATRFTDLGHGYYQSRTDTDRKLKNRIRQIQALGFSVALTRAA